MPTIMEALTQARQHLGAGRASEVVPLCRLVLERFPEEVEAYRLLGSAAWCQGRLEEALELLRRAAQLAPRQCLIHDQLAGLLRDLGRFAEAEAAARQAVALKPGQIEPLLTLGEVLHAQKRQSEAEAVYGQALAMGSKHPALLFRLGNALTHSGRLQEALEVYRQVLALEPGMADAASNAAYLLLQLNRPAEALELGRWALALNPELGEALHHLGDALRALGQPAPAEAAYRQALKLKCPRPEILEVQRGHALREMGKTEEALEAYGRAIASRSDYSEALVWLGKTLVSCGRSTEALEALRQARKVQPGLAEAPYVMGNVLCGLGRLDEASAAYHQAQALLPEHPELAGKVAFVNQALGRYEAAEQAVRQCLQTHPDHPPCLATLGFLLAVTGQRTEAHQALEKALEKDGELPEAHRNRALLLLLEGRWEEGWRAYAWRERCLAWPLPQWSAQARWDGSYLNGRKILVQAEPGLGDNLLLVRYLRRVKLVKGGRVVFLCPPELVPLVAPSPWIEQVVPFGDKLPDCERVVLLGGVPELLGVTPEQTLEAVPYLEADPVRRQRWRAWLSEHSGPAVGVCWQGDAPSPLHWHCPIPASAFASLRDVAGVQWVPLPLDSGAGPLPEEIAALGGRMPEWPKERSEAFQEMAALVAELQLVVTVDSALAHLAGALGVPVWVVLPKTPSWYWQLEREDTAWYPEARLFRQGPEEADWDPVAGRLAREVAGLAEQGCPSENRPEIPGETKAPRKRGWWW